MHGVHGSFLEGFFHRVSACASAARAIPNSILRAGGKRARAKSSCYWNWQATWLRDGNCGRSPLPIMKLRSWLRVPEVDRVHENQVKSPTLQKSKTGHPPLQNPSKPGPPALEQFFFLFES